MNLLAARVVLRPRALPDVLDLAFPFCWRDRRLLGTLGLLVLGPVALLGGLLRIGLRLRWPWVWGAVAAALILVEGAFTVACGELLFREPGEVTARAVIRRFRGAFPRYVFVLVRRMLLLVFSSILIFTPFHQGAATLFGGEALLLELVSVRRAAVRTRALTRGALWFALGLWLTTLMLPALGAVVGDLLGNTLVGFVLQLGHPTGDLWHDGGSGFAVVGALATTPLVAAMRFLGYVDRRTRTEGWDIQLRFVALATGAASPRHERAA